MLEIKLGKTNEKGKRTKRVMKLNGNAIQLMDDLFDVTSVVLNEVLFKNKSIDTQTKFKLLDCYLEAVKKTCEQEICKASE